MLSLKFYCSLIIYCYVLNCVSGFAPPEIKRISSQTFNEHEYAIGRTSCDSYLPAVFDDQARRFISYKGLLAGLIIIGVSAAQAVAEDDSMMRARYPPAGYHPFDTETTIRSWNYSSPRPSVIAEYDVGIGYNIWGYYGQMFGVGKVDKNASVAVPELHQWQRDLAATKAELEVQKEKQFVLGMRLRDLEQNVVPKITSEIVAGEYEPTR